ncbi:hypothetical protein [Actinacidiphila glaucinigra]|uniref:Gram-positive cocci surface proteins LPxTG domain-containing protein n=1 Tax=Actinacidiphila glaucinigra TaxID=235986 RepID=A0A239DN63_9ACTN|nr:hypothetical protein [Actinacidiphila glaucinigra]SNS33561.1 hypothetical protein SAMN05216252_10562 [Actinacidiphila glaucinigra]
MRRPVRRSAFRAVIGLVAAAALAAGFGPASTAFAEDGTPLPVAITGKSHVDLSLQSDGEDSDEPQVTLRLAAPGSDEPGDDGVIPVVHQGPYTIKIDASGLDGVAAVKLPCGAKGLTAVCDGYEINAGETYNEIGDIRLSVDADSAAGDFGTIKVTGEGEGVDFAPLTIDVLVGGPELLGRKLSEPKGLAAGDTYEAPVGFRNVGGMAADGTVLHFHGSRGLSFPDSYGNCAYKATTDGPLLRQGTDAICTFTGTYKAGTAYALSEPLKVKTADFALNDIVNYGFSAVGAQKAKALMANDGYTPGTGAPMTLEEVPGASAGDYARYAELDLPTHSTYDLVLTGASAQGEAGDTVKAEIGFRNDGPGWISALRNGGEPVSFTVAVPEGAKVTKSPERCNLTNIDEGVKGYVCWVETPLLEKTKLSFPFELRIDRVVKNARGKVALPTWDNPVEPEQSNNTAWIVLNGTGDGGGDGSQGSSGDPSATPHPTASGDDASGSTGTSGSDGTSSSGGDSGGGLAFTGAGGALLLGGSALLALGLGAVIIVFVRRRSAA